MARRRLVGLLTGLLVVAWGTFALSYATSRPTEGGPALSVIIGVTFTCVAAALVVLAWTGDEGQQRAAVASLLATAVILLLALLHTWGWGF
jgi:xanthine/uracil permease